MPSAVENKRRATSLLCDEPNVADATALEEALRRVPGVKHVSTKPTENDSRRRKPNHFVWRQLSGGAAEWTGRAASSALHGARSS